MQPIPPRWKRTASLLFTSSAMVVVLTLSASAVNNGSVVCDSAQLVERPTDTADILTTLTKGDTLTILDTKDESYYQVAYTTDEGNSLVGYMNSDNVLINSQFLRTATVIDDCVRLRTSPTLESDIINQLSNGTTVTLLDRIDAENSVWYQVACNGTIGYLAADFLSLDKIASDISVTVSTSLRTAPSKTAGYVRLLTPSDSFDILAVENGWYIVECNGAVGYIETSRIDVGDIYSTPSLGTVVSDSDLPLMETASVDASVLTALPAGTVCGYEASDIDGWYKISFDGQTGYVDSQYIVESESASTFYAQVITETATVLSGAGSIFTQVGELSGGTVVEVNGIQNGWYQIELNDQICFIRPVDATITSSSGYEDPNYPATDVEISNGSSVVEYANQFLGNPYVWGGTSLTNGADCSGFVLSVYANFGYSLPHSSTAMRNCGYAVNYGDMQPGDIVCYDHHVGIYAGNGVIINALNSSSGITYTNVNYKEILAIRRVF